ncbi:MAG: Mrp/NBP35 family ATP-binding protein [Deltaproteobacteria bacterium]|nr:Mrp/NBP35 family ATP-binding protein [Deltaproteobacteria bacterium]
MTTNDVREKLAGIKYPGFTRDIVSFGVVKEIDLDDRRLQVRLSIVTGDEEVAGRIVADVERVLEGLEGLPVLDLVVERGQQGGASAQGDQHAGEQGHSHGAGAAKAHGPEGIPGVAHIVAVASGKGGVGKSTVAANLALALAARGERVGLLDADIYGPSQHLVMGVRDEDRTGRDEQGRFVPVERHGVKLVSMGLFVGEGDALAWRGPMLTRALKQFLEESAWGELDYLVLDLPPGTGDVQLTLTREIKLDGGVVVTTPQDVALADVVRGVKMFEQAGTPVLGVVENMALHSCPSCGHETRIFGSDGAEALARSAGLAMLGSVPLDRTLRESCDSGVPLVVADPESDTAKIFQSIAAAVVDKLDDGQKRGPANGSGNGSMEGDSSSA